MQASRRTSTHRRIGTGEQASRRTSAPPSRRVQASARRRAGEQVVAPVCRRVVARRRVNTGERTQASAHRRAHAGERTQASARRRAHTGERKQASAHRRAHTGEQASRRTRTARSTHPLLVRAPCQHKPAMLSERPPRACMSHKLACKAGVRRSFITTTVREQRRRSHLKVGYNII